MAPSRPLLFLYFSPIPINLLLIFSPAAQSQQDLRYRICANNNGNYTANSTYRHNLNLLLSSLPSNASARNGFYGASAGDRSSDKVSAIALCRGDVTPDGCRRCIYDSALQLVQLCPTQVEAIGGYDDCMLRYSNRSILGGVSEDSPTISFPSVKNLTVNATEFNSALQDMMYRLRRRATSNDTVRKYFATDVVNLTSLQRLYGMVQCTPDLSDESCRSCIATSISQIPDCCDGKQGGRVVKPSCNIRYELYMFYDDTAAAAMVPPPPPPSSNATLRPPSINSTGDGSHTTWTVILAVVPTVALFLGILIGYILRRNKPQKRSENSRSEHAVSSDGDGADGTSLESLHMDFNTIKVATDNFAEVNKLGEGGFGTVYKGKLVNGQEIAVKRLSMDSNQGDVEFKNEVLLVAKLQHRNLVKLLGFTMQGNERLLIYEYVPNASVGHIIFDPVRRLQLNFETRYKIIEGIARGLLYLHEDSRLRIVHRDLKASNILLDLEMNPKISDFGIARLFVVGQSQGNTSKIVGTHGYMAPEYALHGLFSVKSDVFSFGVLILEIVSGQKNNCFRIGETLVDLLTHAWRSWREGTALNIVDPSLRDGSSREIMQCIHIGLLCVQENPEDRPAMASVVVMLSSKSYTLPIPSKPAFFMHSNTESGTMPLQDRSGGTVIRGD